MQAWPTHVGLDMYAGLPQPRHQGPRLTDQRTLAVLVGQARRVERTWTAVPGGDKHRH
jgi:hypothetical protein